MTVSVCQMSEKVSILYSLVFPISEAFKIHSSCSVHINTVIFRVDKYHPVRCPNYYHPSSILLSLQVYKRISQPQIVQH